MSRRYICSACKNLSKDLRAAGEASGARVTNSSFGHTDTDLQYTFMGYDSRCIESLPYGLGREFPALLTHKMGMDLKLVAMMRCLFNHGLRPTQFQNGLAEMHSLEYTRRYLKRENEIAMQKKRIGRRQTDIPESQPFGDFADGNGYGACVPTAKYIKTVYLQNFAEIEKYLDAEVKKRGAEHLSIDASYKEAKLLCK